MYSSINANNRVRYMEGDRSVITTFLDNTPSESIDFELNLALGNILDPVEFNVYLGIDIEFPLFQGWNWMSLNVYSDNMSLDSVFDSLDDNAEYIKSQTGFSDYYSDFGTWYGTLSDMDVTQTYKLNMGSNTDVLEYSGMPVDPSILISLSSGWNWIGYLPSTTFEINGALSSLSNGKFIKSQSEYADYYSDFGAFIDYLIRRMIANNNQNWNNKYSGYFDKRANVVITSIFLNKSLLHVD